MVKPWVDKPFRLLYPPGEAQTKGISPHIVRLATEMTLAHNMIIRNLNAIYLQAPHVSSHGDISDFLIFCQIFVEELNFHHHLEETFLFPKIEEYIGEKGVLDGNVEEHHAFEKGVQEFEKYVEDANVESYSATRIRELIDSFQVVLLPHLEAEISTLLALNKYDGEKVIRAWDEMEGKVLPLIEDKHKVLPFGLGANDRTFDGGKHKFPNFPFFVPYMVNWIYGWKYRRVWRFSPCDVYGKPRELMFVKDE